MLLGSALTILSLYAVSLRGMVLVFSSEQDRPLSIAPIEYEARLHPPNSLDSVYHNAVNAIDSFAARAKMLNLGFVESGIGRCIPVEA